MPRAKEFDQDSALDAAVELFREHGFEGTSTEMLVQGMGIKRQSLYDTFGDKWHLYCSAVQSYSVAETHAHISALHSKTRALEGLEAMMERVIATAAHACLGVGSICEFGQTRPELTKIRSAADRRLSAAVVERLREAQAAGDLASDLNPEEAARFLFANIAGIRIASRAGAGRAQLRTLGRLSLRALS